MSPVSRVQVQTNRPSVTEQVRLSEELMVGGEMVPSVQGEGDGRRVGEEYNWRGGKMCKVQC